MIFLCIDIYFNYIRYFQRNKPAFAYASYTFTAVNFVMLAVLLLWETHAIVKITKSMGDRLKEEVSLLRLIMWCFSISYAFIAIFYMYELFDGMPCRGLDECS